MSESDAQLERLAGRINWLDRYRRALSILLAAIAAPLIIWWISGQLPTEWPGAHFGAIAVAVAAVAWYGIETFFGFVIAVWETDYAKATRTGMPRAQLLRRRRK
jgi:peptidoglycan biosynthesis protein MviN/MurJ (putative lipid II flippase)